MVTPSVTTGQQAFEGERGWPLETRTPSQLVYSAMYRNIPKSSHLPLVSDLFGVVAQGRLIPDQAVSTYIFADCSHAYVMTPRAWQLDLSLSQRVANRRP
jgi:hypothetical protein